jgi:CRP-like cAMP-binding protein
MADSQVDDLAATAKANRILAALPRAEFERLLPLLELVELPQHTVLAEVDEEIDAVYFPVRGVASLVAIGPDGEQVDTAIVGPEGFVGLPVFLGTGQMPVRVGAQVDLTAVRLSARGLRRELERGGRLVNLLQRYAQMVLVELALLVLCNRAHSIEHRAARWILQLDERLPAGLPFAMTQGFLASMIGSPRPHVSSVLHSLREHGLIDYGRGAIEVLDRGGLEAAACGCYRTIRSELDRLLSTDERYDITRRH